jgi:hypothetical protein
MLFIDFANLNRKYPELQDVWRGLEEWVKDHPTTSVIDTRSVTREIRIDRLDPDQLLRAFNRLKEQAGLSQFYRVFNPSTNQFLKGEWTTFESVPEKVLDAFDNFVSIEDLRIVPILRR